MPSYQSVPVPSGLPPGWQVRHIAAAVGYLSDHYFHRCFKQAYGVTPSDYRRGLGPV